MKLLILPSLLMLSTAAAADVNCSTLRLTSSLYGVVYKTKGVFPEPGKDVYLNLFKLKAPFKACGVTVSTTQRNGLIISVQAASNADLETLINPYGTATSLDLPLKLTNEQGKIIDGLDVQLTLLDLYTMYQADIFVKPVLYTKTTVGFKVDGGKTQPFFYNDDSRKIEFSKKAKVVDIYVKSTLSTSWQRLTVDLTAHKLTLYSLFPFPRD